MPLDSNMYAYHQDEIFYQRAIWHIRFSWLPRRCALSNQQLWLTFAYKGTAMYSGPGEPIFEYKWIAKEQFLFARLKGKI